MKPGYSFNHAVHTDLGLGVRLRPTHRTRTGRSSTGEQLYKSVLPALKSDYHGRTQFERLDAAPGQWDMEYAQHDELGTPTWALGENRRASIERNRQRREAKALLQRERVRLAWAVGLGSRDGAHRLRMGLQTYEACIRDLDNRGELRVKDGDAVAWDQLMEALA